VCKTVITYKEEQDKDLKRLKTIRDDLKLNWKGRLHNTNEYLRLPKRKMISNLH